MLDTTAAPALTRGAIRLNLLQLGGDDPCRLLGVDVAHASPADWLNASSTNRMLDVMGKASIPLSDNSDCDELWHTHKGISVLGLCLPPDSTTAGVGLGLCRVIRHGRSEAAKSRPAWEI
jgi:hypothetical protein